MYLDNIYAIFMLSKKKEKQHFEIQIKK